MPSQTPKTPEYKHVNLSDENIKILHALSKRMNCDFTTDDNNILAQGLRTRGRQIVADFNNIVIEH